MSSEAKNLEAITNAIKQHNASCDFPATAVVLNPFEWERLGWDEIMGVAIISDPKVSTGRFVILCDGQHGPKLHEEVHEDIEVVSPNREVMPA